MIIGLTGRRPSALVVGGLALLRRADPRRSTAPLDNEALGQRPRTSPRWSTQDRLPDPLPVSGAQVVQVVDAQQRVVGGSVDRGPADAAAAARRAAPGAGRGGAGGRRRTARASAGPLRVVAVPAGPAAEPVTRDRGGARRRRLASRTALRNALLITFPLLLAVLAVIAWRVIGWTLRPVEAAAGRGGADQRARRWAGAARRAAAGAAGRRRDPGPGRDPQRHARPAGRRPGAAAGVRRRRRARAAQPAGQHADPARGGPAARRGRHACRPTCWPTSTGCPRLVEDLLLLARSDADARPPARPSRWSTAGACWSRSPAAYAGRGCRSPCGAGDAA